MRLMLRRLCILAMGILPTDAFGQSSDIREMLTFAKNAKWQSSVLPVSADNVVWVWHSPAPSAAFAEYSVSLHWFRGKPRGTQSDVGHYILSGHTKSCPKLRLEIPKSHRAEGYELTTIGVDCEMRPGTAEATREVTHTLLVTGQEHFFMIVYTWRLKQPHASTPNALQILKAQSHALFRTVRSCAQPTLASIPQCRPGTAKAIGQSIN